MNINHKRNINAKHPARKLFLILFSFSLFFVLGTIFISYSFNTTHISQRDLYKGEDFNLNDNDSLTLRFEKERHKINVTIFGSNSIDITVYSEPVTKHIKINETVFFDLNNDSKNDLRVWLIEIVNYNAIVEFKRVDDFYCKPEWTCSKWGGCIDGLRKRNCEDVKRCGKPETIPDLEKFCSSVLEDSNESNQKEIDETSETESSNLSSLSDSPKEGELTCLENSGNPCSDLQECQGDWIISSDSLRCCFGDCYFPNIDLEGSIICDRDITSFRLAVYNCTPFTMDCIENILVPELGIIQRFESVLKIHKYSPGNNCLFEYSYGDVFMNYTYEKYNELFDEGKTIVQIDFELGSLRTDFTNKFQDKTMTCEYPQNEFLSFARNWEDGKTEWSRDVLGKYECTGNLTGL